MLHLQKKLVKEFAKDQNHRKVRDHWRFTGKYGGAAHSIWTLRLNMPNEIPIVFHNGSNHDYHFIIR